LAASNGALTGTRAVDPHQLKNTQTESDCEMILSATIVASTHIGCDCVFHSGTVVGGQSQAHGHKPVTPKIHEPLIIVGNNPTIHEFSSIYQSVTGASASTTIGDHVYIMSNVHAAHDCIVEGHWLFQFWYSVLVWNEASAAGCTTVQVLALWSVSCVCLFLDPQR
jgi:acyl-[acyl carrier protein]--UDP-N-acetylglucosamine O-acyltransferase